VAYLLFNPPLGGLHGTELASLAFGYEVVQEASLSADGDSTRRLIQKQAREWLAVLQKPSSSETEKDEAREELEKLAEAMNVTRADSNGGAEKQVRAVRRAIERLIDKLRGAKDRKGDPHVGLRAFGEHLHEYVWKPSSRFSGDRRARARAGVAGRFTYERPADVVWEE
jgi:plasmid stabilization system protein ParE